MHELVRRGPRAYIPYARNQEIERRDMSQMRVVNIKNISTPAALQRTLEDVCICR
jgi:hypothetical protein